MSLLESSEGKARILFVDDEKNILNSLNRLFFDEEYEIFLANSAQEALEILRIYEMQVIISDQRMPRMTGVAFLIKTQELYPDSVRIILTGYADIDAAMKAINEGAVYKFISKPWNDAELKLVVRRAVELYHLQKKNKELFQQIQRQNQELKELNENLNLRVKERTKTILQKNQELTELNQRLSEGFGRVVRLLVNFLELKSHELCGHSKRVAAASRFIATDMGLSDEELETVEISALLHDIGKISLPEKILLKNMNLMTPEELSHYQQHSLLGERVLANIEQLDKVRRIIRHHHENFNGSGYPDHLKGEEIPQISRIIAVTDAYDRLVNRVYVNISNTRLRAIKALRLKMGTELDSAIVNRMVDFLHRRKEKVNERREVEVKPFEVRENMILSRDLYTSRGVLLFSKDKRLEEADIKVVLDSERLEKLLTSVFVYI